MVCHTFADKTTPLEFNANIDDIIYRIANASGIAVSELTKEAKTLLRGECNCYNRPHIIVICVRNRRNEKGETSKFFFIFQVD
jgi:hypothetical protein